MTEGRNSKLTSVAGILRNEGKEWPEIYNELLSRPERNGLSEREVLSIAKSIGKYEVHKPKRPVPGVVYDSPLHEFAAARGYSIEALRRLGAEGHDTLAFNGMNLERVVSFPMRDCHGQLIGRRVRNANNTGIEHKGESKKSLGEARKSVGVFMPWPFPELGPIYIAEGETKAVMLLCAGAEAVVCTPSDRIGEAVFPDLVKLCAYRDCYLFPDPGESGQRWLNRAAESVRSGGGTPYFVPSIVVDIDDRLYREPDKKAALKKWVGKAIKWQEGDKAEDIQSDEPPKPNEWAPINHLDLTEEDIPYPLASVYPSVLCDMLRATSEVAECPTAIAAVYAFSCISFLLAGKNKIMPRKGWEEPPQLYMLGLAKIGRGKSRAMEEIAKPLKKIEVETRTLWKEESSKAETRRAILEGQKKKLVVRAQKEGLPECDMNVILGSIEQIEGQLAQLPKASEPKMTVENFTPERLATILEENDERICILTDEAEMFGNMGRYAGKGSVSKQQVDLLTKGYNCLWTSIDRMGRAPVHLQSPSVAIGATVQPKRMMPVLEDEDFQYSGFLARFLMAWPKSVVNLENPRRRPVPHGVSTRWSDLIEWLHAHPWNAQVKGQRGWYAITYSVQAESLLADIEIEVRKRNTTLGDLADIEDWATRLAGQVLRISAVLHACSCFELEDRPWPYMVPISEDTVQCAWELVQYYIWHLKRVVLGTDQDITSSAPVRVLRWVRANGARHIYNSERWLKKNKLLFGKEDMGEAFDILMDRGYIRPERMKDARGRTRDGFAVNPAFLAMKDEELIGR